MFSFVKITNRSLRLPSKNNKLFSIYKGLTGAQIAYQKILENKVKDVFLYSGGAIMPLVDQFYQSKDIRYYVNTHEQNSGHAATGYAKSTGKTGVCLVTSGPGLTNMVTPMLDATNDSTPLVVFSGQVPVKAMGSLAFQECPATEITSPVTKWSYCVKDVNELPEVIDEAFQVAQNGKKGSVHIDLPKCVSIKEYQPNQRTNFRKKNNLITSEPVDSEKINKVAKLIDSSKSPVLYIGQGCNPYSDLLTKLARKANIPVTTTIHAMGVFDEQDPLSLNFLGMHGHPAANHAMQQSDLIIALGTRFDDRTTGVVEKYAPKALEAHRKGNGGIIHVNINPDEINKVLDTHYNFQMDCGVFLSEIVDKVSQNGNRDKWMAQIADWKQHMPFQYHSAKDNKLKTQQVIEGISDYLLQEKHDNYLISTGVGNHQMMAAQFIQWKYPSTYISSGSLGVMGAGLPYAIGCQIANRDKLVIDIDGDSSFNHTLSDMKTIKEYNLPVKIAIMNDGHQSMVRVWEKLFFEERYTATTLNHNPDYQQLAESYGIKAITCDNQNDLKDNIKYFLEYPGPILGNFKVETDLCLPLVAPGKALDEMITFDQYFEINNLVDSKSAPPS